MKIIRTDNFNREKRSDLLIAENVHKYFGEFLTKELNNRYSGETSPDYFRLVPDDYKLYKWEP